MDKQNGHIVPAWQQAIIDKCYHPTGVWEEFALSSVENTLARRFTEIAGRYPDRPAIISADSVITYAQLERQAEKIAQNLRDCFPSGTHPPVALLVEHNEAAIVGIWGVMKSAAPFVVLESSWPLSHLRSILNTLSAPFLLTDEDRLRMAQSVAPLETTVLVWNQLPDQPEKRCDDNITPDFPACIQYTSGSTGEPKGLVTTQRGVLFTAASLINTLHISSEDRLLLVNRPGYGGHLSVVAGALFVGASVCLYDPKSKGIRPLYEWLRDSQTTIWISTPALFREFVATLTPDASLPAVRVVRLHGDRTLRSDYQAYVEFFPDSCLFRNDLGMTELGRISQFMADKETTISSSIVPVGYPYPGVEYWIEDEAGRRVGAGETGEIVLSSAYLSPGYYVGNDRPLQHLTRNDDKTPQPAPFRTGDEGMIDEAGCLHHLGRLNSEVKIRGYRINLSHLEAVVCEHKNVANAIAVVKEQTDGNAHIILLVVPKNWELSLHIRPQLFSTLSSRLPAQMLPSQIVIVDHLPLNANGKVDRRNLSIPTPFSHPNENRYISPRTSIEAAITRHWRDVLGLDAIGIHDPFLELGGNSLQAMRIAARVQEEFGVEIPLTELFAASTVAEMALAVTEVLMTASALTRPEEFFDTNGIHAIFTDGR